MSHIVIIGGSFSGLRASSEILKQHPNVTVTVISPSTKLFFNVASPRLLVEPAQISKTLIPVKEVLAQQGGKRAKFVHGLVEAVDFDNKTVKVASVAPEEGEAETEATSISYDVLVIASGTKSKFAGFKINDGYKEVTKALEETNEALKKASKVAILGGGPTGVEVAGEIASFFKAKVSLYPGKSGILSTFPKLTGPAKAKLESLGVEIINSTKENPVKTDATTLEFDGKTLTYDVIIESFISEPCTSFLPESVKDSQGYVVTEGLSIKGHEEVFVLGDVLAAGCKTIIDLKFGQIPLFKQSLKDVLEKLALGKAPSSATPAKKYEPVMNMIAVPISKNGGVGIAFGFKLPSFLVKFAKSKTFMIDKAKEMIDQ